MPKEIPQDPFQRVSSRELPLLTPAQRIVSAWQRELAPYNPSEQLDIMREAQEKGMLKATLEVLEKDEARRIGP